MSQPLLIRMNFLFSRDRQPSSLADAHNLARELNLGSPLSLRRTPTSRDRLSVPPDAHPLAIGDSTEVVILFFFCLSLSLSFSLSLFLPVLLF